jgi:acetyl-CoA carboxylase carboxyltransferase component
MNKDINIIEDPAERADFINEQENNYRDKFANPYVAAKYGYIDEVIEPRNTRYRIIRALESLVNKRDTNPPKKHSNIPL